MRRRLHRRQGDVCNAESSSKGRESPTFILLIREYSNQRLSLHCASTFPRRELSNMSSLPGKPTDCPIIDPLFLQELEERLRLHDGHFFWVVRFLDEYYCQSSINIEALWARIYLTLRDTGTLFLAERCRINLMPRGCDVERLDAVSTYVSQIIGQPEKILEMFDNWSVAIARREWETIDNRRRLERLSGSQSARDDEFTASASHNLVADQPAHNENTTLSQHLAEVSSEPQVTPSTVANQPAQIDHLNAAQQNTNSPIKKLDSQPKKSDLEFIMSRNEAPISKSSWKKTSMQLPPPFPNFPISDVRNEGKGKQPMGPPPLPQHIDGPYVQPLRKPIEAPDAHIEPLSSVRAPNITGLSPQKQAELVLQQLRDHGERHKARTGKYRSVADELKKGQTQADKEGGDVEMGGQ
ncbi:hypothetical protein QM012_000111 [Aureobasidium pullulans]|uniref:Uncharacterized protein n=1 Tax=Aureobasidium pullulans TaxID=5580 RepID=A0ABR0TUS5_AURPU